MLHHRAFQAGISTAMDAGMKRTESTPCKMLHSVFHRDVAIDCLMTSAALIRKLPLVLRVRADLDTHQLEILHQCPTLGLIEDIGLLWSQAGGELRVQKIH